MVLFDVNARARFGEVFDVANSRLEVRHCRRIGDILHPVSTRPGQYGQYVKKTIKRICLREELVFVI
jgi:hypothetical protein